MWKRQEAQAKSGNRSWRVVLVGLLLLGCLGGVLGLGTAVQGLGAPLGVQVCAGIVTSSPWQVGVAWVSPISSYLPPIMTLPTKACVNLPPALSPARINGELVIRGW
ncbi:MAG: hypothetical protein IAE79_10865 [Anaerolinea sp.]|nr:hypothetical protein [Anaerolinea sp.]